MESPEGNVVSKFRDLMAFDSDPKLVSSQDRVDLNIKRQNTSGNRPSSVIRDGLLSKQDQDQRNLETGIDGENTRLKPEFRAKLVKMQADLKRTADLLKFHK